MGSSIVALVSNFFSFLGGLVGYRSKELDLKNTADMKAGAERADEQKAKDEIAKAIASKDTDAIKKIIAD